MSHEIQRSQKISILRILPPIREAGQLFFPVVWSDGKEGWLTEAQLKLDDYLPKVDHLFTPYPLPNDNNQFNHDALQWTIEEIKGDKVERGTQLFFVKYVGWGLAYNDWVARTPENQEIISQYLQQKGS